MQTVIEKFRPLVLLSIVVVAYGATDEVTQVELKIDRMMCGGCTSRVKKLIESQPGTSNVSVRLEDHRASFSCKKTKGSECDLNKIVKSLRKIGFPPKVVSR